MRSHIKLDIHQHVCCGRDRKYITLENEEVCYKVWMSIIAVSKTVFYRQHGSANLGVWSSYHGNKGIKE